MKITEHRKNWIMVKVAKYAKQLGIVSENHAYCNGHD
jgi:hypothetical protein